MSSIREQIRIQFNKKCVRLSEKFALKFDIENIEESLSMFGKRLTSKNKNLIRTIHKACQETIPGMFDFHFEFTPKYGVVRNEYGHNLNLEIQTFEGVRVSKMDVIVYFPEIEINNGRDSGFTLNNLFVRIPFYIYESDFYDMFPEHMEGVRTTFSYEEYRQGYSHSHLNIQSFTSRESHRCRWQQFCLGTADINATRSILQGIGTKNLEYLKLLFLQIQPFVEWESIDGGPYLNYIDVVNIKDYGIYIPTETELRTVFELTKKIIIEEQPVLTWSYTSSNEKFKIIDNDNLEKFLMKLEDYVPVKYLDYYFIYKDNKGNAYKISNEEKSGFIDQNNYIIFRRQKYYFTVLGTRTSTEVKTKFINPYIKKYVREKLEYITNNYQVEKATVKWLDTCDSE